MPGRLTCATESFWRHWKPCWRRRATDAPARCERQTHRGHRSATLLKRRDHDDHRTRAHSGGRHTADPDHYRDEGWRMVRTRFCSQPNKPNTKGQTAMMDKDTRERLDHMGERMTQLTEAHIELETAQKNTSALIDKFVQESTARGREFDERLENMRILVDHLIRRDMEGGQTT